jgi:hypothetical protein
VGDVGHDLKPRIVLQPFCLCGVEKQDLPIGFVRVWRNPPAPILATKTGFRIFLDILDRIFGVRLSASIEHGPSSACDRLQVSYYAPAAELWAARKCSPANRLMRRTSLRRFNVGLSIRPAGA